MVKHEALAVRRARAGVASEDVDLDAVPAVAQRSVEERLESAERVARSAEVMRRLKRDEARALMLKAEGLSYVEIGERLGWTYTKVNRCITEGRRRFMRLYEELETGAECERLAPTLVALAAGDASSDALLELRPHLRNCPACRATVRELHASRLRRLTAFLPLGAVVEPARAFLERFRGRGGGAEGEAEQAVQLRPLEEAEKLDEAFRRLNGGEAALQPVAPSVAEHVGRVTTVRVNLRGWLETGLQRLQSSDVALGIHTAASGGGGRVASVAALIGICVSGVGAGTYCVATALLPDPKPAVRSEAKPPAKRMRADHGTSAKRASVVSTSSPAAGSPGSALPATPKRRPASRRRSRATRDAGQSDEFSFETGSRAQAASSTGGVGRSGMNSSPANASFESGASASTPPAVSSNEFEDGAGGEFSP